jgi:hypothetical protein
MLIAQAAASPPDPILPATNEALWTVSTIAFAVLMIVLLVLVVRWAGFHLGFQLGRLGHRNAKPQAQTPSTS